MPIEKMAVNLEISEAPPFTEKLSLVYPLDIIFIITIFSYL